MTISENVDLLSYNTFGIRSTARYFAVCKSEEDIRLLLNDSLFKRERRLFLGGGSNVLFTGDYSGIVAHIQVKGIHIVREDDDAVEIQVGAGVTWHELVLHCVAHDWGGIENLSLIPGTTGAAPMQNIGAYGVEVKDVITEVHALEVSSSLRRSVHPAPSTTRHRHYKLCYSRSV